MDKFSKKKIILPGKASQEILRNRPPPIEEAVQSVNLGRDYVSAIVKKNEENFRQHSKMSTEELNQENRSHCSLSEVDSMTNATLASPNEENYQLYQKYNFDLDPKEGSKAPLLIHDYKEQILCAIEACRVVIIKGATGCGKTTKVPQFILNSAKEKGVNCNIVVTQPRRLAAISVATRVAAERKCPLGTLVGYQIGQAKFSSDDTRILYVTTGVLLQKLIANKEMNEFTHYILDEIHERNQDMDFLLIVVRQLMNLRSKQARLIVMSATMETSIFYKYLQLYYYGQKLPPTPIEIYSKTQYPVHTFYLDDLSEGGRIIEAASLIPFEPDCPIIFPNAYKTAARIIMALHKIDSNKEDNNKSSDRKLSKPAFLVFLPGLHEIETMEKVLKETCSPEQLSLLWIKPLHSSITADEQQDVFKSPPKPSMQKIILSTNIAESSITVSDIEYVIDFCLTKVLVTDPSTNCTSLELAWASKHSLIQRAGRVGRVSEGRVYRMITKKFYDINLDEESVPEILRCSLESLVLKAKLLEMGPPKKILALAMDQPDLRNIHQAVANLKEIGALHLYVDNRRYDQSDGDLTLLGKVIARLPLDVRLGKLIFLGNVFGVAEESIVMACAMATKNIFSTPYGKHLEAYNQKLFWADSSCSDCIAFLNAYRSWRRNQAEGSLRNRAQAWARDNYLQLKALCELATLEDDIKQRLKNENLYSFEKLKELKDFNRDEGTDDRAFFLKLAIAGAFYPNYFIRGTEGTQYDEETAINTLGGNDPFSTVYLQGLLQNQPNVIYKKTIKKLFQNISCRLDVNVDNSSKAYITFHPSLSNEHSKGIPGKIQMNVYRALKMRQVGVRFAIPKLRQEDATRIHYNYLKDNPNSEDTNTDLKNTIDSLIWPWKKDGEPSKILAVLVCYVESPQRFWVQSSSQSARGTLRQILQVLNNEDNLIQLEANADLDIGSMYVSMYVDGKSECFYRCRIISKDLKKKKYAVEYTYTIYFVDFGNTQSDLPADQIYDVVEEVKEREFIYKLPELAVECSLAKIQPSNSRVFNENTSSNQWNERSCKQCSMVQHKETFAKVYSYSILNNVLKVKLVLPEKKDLEYKFENTLNHLLIQKGHAKKGSEDILSLRNREDWKRRMNTSYDEEDNVSVQSRTFKRKDDDSKFDNFDLSVNAENKSEIILKGPFSPLEMKISGITQATEAKPVRVDKDSVNSVLLDSEPSDPNQRMLVSAFVGTNATRDRLNLKHTTIMPNLPALPMLCCLVFSPMVELRCNPNCTKYSGALCGLGYDRKTQKSYFPENDVEIAFDYELQNDTTLVLINNIRYWLNVAVDPEPIRGKVTKEDVVLSTKNLKSYLRQLFLPTNIDYQLLNMHHTVNSYHWGLIDENKLKDPCPIKDIRKHPTDYNGHVYRLIWGIRLPGDVEKEIQTVLKNLEQLKEFGNKLSSLTSIECILCQVSLKDAAKAKLHTRSAIHRARSEAYLKMIEASKTKASTTRQMN